MLDLYFLSNCCKSYCLGTKEHVKIWKYGRISIVFRDYRKRPVAWNGATVDGSSVEQLSLTL